MNRTINEALRCRVPEGEESMWEVYLPNIIFSINNLTATSTGVTPSAALLKWTPRNPLSKAFNQLLEKKTDSEIILRQRKATEVQKRSFDKRNRVKKREVNPGDLVRVKIPPSMNKLKPKWSAETFPILRTEPSTVVFRDKRGREKRYHKDLIRVCVPKSTQVPSSQPDKPVVISHPKPVEPVPLKPILKQPQLKAKPSHRSRSHTPGPSTRSAASPLPALLPIPHQKERRIRHPPSRYQPNLFFRQFRFARFHQNENNTL